MNNSFLVTTSFLERKVVTTLFFELLYLLSLVFYKSVSTSWFFLFMQEEEPHKLGRGVGGADRVR